MAQIVDRNNLLRSYFNTNWSYTKIAWDNLIFDNSKETSWVSFKIVDAQSQQVAIGANRMYRYYGGINIKINTLAGRSDTEAFTLADNAINLFLDKVIGTIVFNKAPYITNSGINGKWFTLLVTCPFFFDVIP